jgi:hypothetical protein
MNSLNKSRTLFVLFVVLVTSFLDLSRPFDPGRPLVQEARAVVGRPLTPISYAGVARRTTRRSVAAGAYGGYGPYGASPYW